MKCSFKFTCSRRSVFFWILGIVGFSASGLIILSPDWCQKIVNPWSEHGRTYCSKLYDVCISNAPEWSIKIPARTFIHQKTPIFSFLVLDFKREEIAPEIVAEIQIVPDSLRRFRHTYEIVNSLDFLSFLKYQANLTPNFQITEDPIAGALNGMKMAVMWGTFKKEAGAEVKFKTFGFVVGSRGYTITYSAEEKHFDQYLPEAVKIIESVKFGKDVKE